jgi:hypothetical protein
MRVRRALTHLREWSGVAALLLVLTGGVAYAANTVGSADVINESLLSQDIKNGEVKVADIGQGAVATDELANGQVKVADIGDGEVKTAEIANGQVLGADIGAGEVRSANVANDNLTGGDIAANSLNGVDIDEPTLDLDTGIGSEPWREIGAAGQPPFHDDGFCTWVNFDGGWNTAAFFRDRSGVVHLKGLIALVDQSPSYECDFDESDPYDDEVIFTLPAGYRPVLRNLFATLAGDQLGRVDVTQNGVVKAVNPPTAEANARVYLQLDGISFRCAPKGANGCP